MLATRCWPGSGGQHFVWNFVFLFLFVFSIFFGILVVCSLDSLFFFVLSEAFLVFGWPWLGSIWINSAWLVLDWCGFARIGLPWFDLAWEKPSQGKYTAPSQTKPSSAEPSQTGPKARQVMSSHSKWSRAVMVQLLYNCLQEQRPKSRAQGWRYTVTM